MGKFLKLFISLIFLFIFFVKPLYTFIIFVMMVLSNLYLISYLYNIYTYKNKYYCLYFSSSHLVVDNIIDMWINYSKFLAFNRLHKILQRSRPSPAVLIIFILFYFLNIPFLLINVYIHMLKSKERTIYQKFYEVFYFEWLKTKNKKVEVINGVYYLNNS